MPAPSKAIAPPKIHTSMTSTPLGTNFATTDGLRKIPEPTMPPITMSAASRTPRRLRSGMLGCEYLLCEFVDDRTELGHATHRCGMIDPVH